MSDLPAGLETLEFTFSGGRPAGPFSPVLVGVVGSGNLEVLLEAAPVADGTSSTACAVHVETSARGFGPIWQAVLSDFHDRHRLGGLRVSVNDMGATPAVVSLRLDQAVAEITGALP